MVQSRAVARLERSNLWGIFNARGLAALIQPNRLDKSVANTLRPTSLRAAINSGSDCHKQSPSSRIEPTMACIN